MQSYADVIKRIEASNTVGIFIHTNPDGDCIGSALSLYAFLRKKGKTVYCYVENNGKNAPLPEKLAFLPYSEFFNSAPPYAFDLSIGVDVADASRLGDECFRLFKKGKKSIVIDHHEGTDFADLTIRETGAAATTQIIYKILAEYDKNLIDSKIAALLYTGLVTDSGCFSFQSVSTETFIIAAELLKFNFDHADLVRKLMKDKPLNVFNLTNRVLGNAKFFDDGKIGMVIYRAVDFEETNTTEDNTEGIINNILNVRGIELAVSVAEVGDKKFKVSFRSKTNFSAAALARCFGGGGHFHAAGCRLYGYFEDVIEKILSAAREMFTYV